MTLLSDITFWNVLMYLDDKCGTLKKLSKYDTIQFSITSSFPSELGST